MMSKRALFYCVLLSSCIVTIGLFAQQAATEAPAGFDTPTLQTQNAGSQSSSNGISEPPGDTFIQDQQLFERREDPALGLGPVFNATSCSECHQNPVTGGPSQITELRVGHKDENGNFVNPTIAIIGGTISGRSLVNDRATCPQVQEHVPDTENIRALRAVLNTLGDGFVEAIDDKTLTDIAANQPNVSQGRIQGEAVQVPILEAPGHTRVGRFGWKDQHGSLLSFTADAYLNEMGVTSRLKPVDTTSICKTKSDPEDTPDELGLANIDHFTQFVRGTKSAAAGCHARCNLGRAGRSEAFRNDRLQYLPCRVDDDRPSRNGAQRWRIHGARRAPAVRSFIPSAIFCCTTSVLGTELYKPDLKILLTQGAHRPTVGSAHEGAIHA